MRTTLTVLEGQSGIQVALRRAPGHEQIAATILSEDCPEGEKHVAPADDRDAVFELARIVQAALDGGRGTNSMIHDVFRELQRFMD